MPADIILDTVENTTLESGRDFTRLLRTGIIRNIPSVGTSDAGAIFAAAQAVGLPEINDAHPVVPELKLTRRVIKPWSARVAKLYLYYDNLTAYAGIPVGSWVIRDQTMMVEYETDLVPGTRVPIRTGAYTLPGGGKLSGENVKMKFLRPMRQISQSKLYLGSTPPESVLIGCVNSNVYRGYPPGFWLCTSRSSDVTRYSGSYVINSTITSRVSEDWSETGILFSRMTQKKVSIPPADITSMLALSYSYGIIYEDKGMVRVGPYEAKNFTTELG